MHKARYEFLTKDRKKPLLLCGTCQAKRKKMEASPERFDVKCPECGAVRKTDLFTAWACDNGYFPLRCEECRAQVTMTCQSCGKQIVNQKYYFDRQIKKGKPIRCQDCLTETVRTCSRCGTEVKGRKFYFDDLEKQGKSILCRACLDDLRSSRRSYRT